MSSDYSARKNEVIASYEQLEELVSELQNYAKSIDLPDPMERLTVNKKNTMLFKL